MKDNKIVEGKEALIYTQKVQKQMEGSVDNAKLQAFLKDLYEYNQAMNLTLDEKINYIYSEDLIMYEPYANLLLGIYQKKSDSFALAYDKLYTMDESKSDIYNSWKLRVLSDEQGNQQDVEQLLRQVSIPFHFESGAFISCALSYIQDLMLLLFIVVCTIFASMFSKDRLTGCDQVILTTSLGRRRLRKARCHASLLFSTLIFICVMILYHVIIASQIGINGLHSSIQMEIFKLSPYSLTAIQAYVLILLFAYCMNISITMIVLYASNRMKKSYPVILVSFLLLFVSYMLVNGSTTTSKFLLFLPFGLIEKSILFSYCNVQIANMSIWFPCIVVGTLMVLVLGLRYLILKKDE